METASASLSRNTKTHRRLRKAYCRLIRKNQYDKMSVSSLVEEADISRATFYLYFKNIEEFEDDTFKYMLSLFAEQIVKFLLAGKTKAKETCKRKNLIFTDDDFELFSCICSVTPRFDFNKKVFETAFDELLAYVNNYFDKSFIKKNKDRFNLFYIGYACVMIENFLDYHSSKVYRDILRTAEMWDFLFPEHKFRD